MNFSEALEKLKTGHLMQRAGWNGKGMFVMLDPSSQVHAINLPFLSMFSPLDQLLIPRRLSHVTVPGQIVPWTISHMDVLADDWQVFEREKRENA